MAEGMKPRGQKGMEQFGVFVEEQLKNFEWDEIRPDNAREIIQRFVNVAPQPGTFLWQKRVQPLPASVYVSEFPEVLEDPRLPKRRWRTCEPTYIGPLYPFEAIVYICALAYKNSEPFERDFLLLGTADRMLYRVSLEDNEGNSFFVNTLMPWDYRELRRIQQISEAAFDFGDLKYSRGKIPTLWGSIWKGIFGYRTRTFPPVHVCPRQFFSWVKTYIPNTPDYNALAKALFSSEGKRGRVQEVRESAMSAAAAFARIAWSSKRADVHGELVASWRRRMKKKDLNFRTQAARLVAKEKNCSPITVIRAVKAAKAWDKDIL